MKLKLKNGNLVNTTYSLAYIVLSYVFTLWYQIEYLAFEVEASRAIVFLIFNIIFVVLTLCFLKLSNRNIAILIITIFSIISLKVYATGPMQILLNNKFNDSLPKEAIITFAFIVEIIIFISNLAVSFYAIFRLHELQENKSNI
ncbi:MULTISPECIES: hypothetical protein [unclassified Clostridium]|jgi:hypothetical protein|uniref:hypothetical protein n=1 Tax=unclassified Clostridium TaxID=2614128 RepID=UPI0025FEA282|nr:hypothetical protein [Clostridium sp.]MCI6691644.1 hypothetical protein [Clostridium sp.]MDY2631042.1 hypothetical protein [Clostridium sp.]MDY4253190.1 hypothetical protein [Clostridium sp.]